MKPLDHTIRTLRELTETWRFIDGDLGYDSPQLFAIYADRHGLMVPTVIQVYDSDLPDGLDEVAMSQLLEVHRTTLRDEVPFGSLALMRARPGPRALTADDRAWCRMAHGLLEAASFRTWPLFFATDRSVGVVPPDVLVAETG